MKTSSLYFKCDFNTALLGCGTNLWCSYVKMEQNLKELLSSCCEIQSMSFLLGFVAVIKVKGSPTPYLYGVPNKMAGNCACFQFLPNYIYIDA